MSNDTIQTASPITATSQTFNDSLSSTDLNDYFQFTLSNRSSISLILENLTADVNVQLLDSVSSLLQSSTNQGQAAELINRILEPGTYTIRVFLGNSTAANYTLDLTLQSGGQINTLWRDYSTGSNTVWTMGGTNNTSTLTSAILPVASNNWTITTIADWSGDGINDIVWRDYVNGTNTIWLMDGSGTIASYLTLPDLSPNWEPVGVADFSEDGNLDILWREINNGMNGFWLMGGTNKNEINSIALLPDLTNNWLGKSGDFNNDGKPDIFWHDYISGSNGIWYLDGTTYVGAELLAFSISPDARLQGIVDFDQDNQPDVLWRMPNGDNLIWFMDGKTFKSADSLGITSSTIWITPFQSNDLAPIDPVGNTSAMAFSIGNLTGTATYRDRIDTTDPEDYYRFTLESTADLTLSLSGLPASSLQLLNSSGNVTTNYTNLSAGTYFVRVVNGSGDYTLTLAAAPPPPPTITITATDAQAAETTNGQTANPGQFTITRSGSTTGALTINYAVSGTATNDTDYSSLGTSITIPAGQSSITIPITVLDDSLVEGNETVILTLSPAGSYTIGTSSSATVTIADNDQAPVLPTITISSSTNAAEPSTAGSFTISRTGSTAQSLNIKYGVAGTATNGTDYQALGQNVVIPIGQASVTIPVTVNDDSAVEGDETVILTLASDSAYTIGSTATRTITISDNDITGDGAGNTLATARDIGDLTTIQQTFTDRVDNTDKKDYYCFRMPISGTLRATITGNTADIDIELLREDGYLIDFSDSSGVKDESINRFLPAGIYYLFVYPYGNAQSNYTLNVWRV